MGVSPLEPRHTNKRQKAWNKKQEDLLKQGPKEHEQGKTKSVHEEIPAPDPTAAMDDLALAGEDFEGYFYALPD